jgi:ribosomal protein S18 acetylase RimI-like enzyme
MNTHFRRAGVPDAPEIAACVQRAYAKYADRLPVPPRPVLADYAAVVQGSLTWLLEADGLCVGVLVLVPHADHLLLDNVAIDPAYQGRGLGRRLLEFAEAEARRQGLPAVWLETNALMTENLVLYTARGYVEAERRIVDGRHIVYMRKQLA